MENASWIQNALPASFANTSSEPLQPCRWCAAERAQYFVASPGICDPFASANSVMASCSRWLRATLRTSPPPIAKPVAGTDDPRSL